MKNICQSLKLYLTLKMTEETKCHDFFVTSISSRITVKHELLSTAWTTDNGQRTRVDFELCLNTN